MRNRGVRAFICGGTLFCAFAGPAFAAPVVSAVSGSIAHGQQVQITGSGFGQKSPAKPYLWAPMDGTHQPSPLGTVTSWTAIDNMAYAAGEGMAGGGALKGTIKGSGGGETVWTARVDASGFAWSDYGQKMYLFRRTKKNWVWTSQHNWKTFRAWPLDANGTQPNWFMSQNGLDVSPPISAGGYIFADGVAASIWGPANVWLNEEILSQSNSANGTRNGAYYYYVNGALKGDATPAENMFGLKDTGTQPIQAVYVVHGVEANDANSAVVPAGGTYWADDVYLDRTWARVMIGNAPTLANSTHLEVQIPAEWSADQIRVTLNTQSFPSGATPYLFVVDASGSASAGYPIGDIVRPKSIQDLSAK